MSRTLDEIRAEHYDVMVSMLAGWLQLHGEITVVHRALRDASKLEIERLRLERRREATPAETP